MTDLRCPNPECQETEENAYFTLTVMVGPDRELCERIDKLEPEDFTCTHCGSKAVGYFQDRITQLGDAVLEDVRVHGRLATTQGGDMNADTYYLAVRFERSLEDDKAVIRSRRGDTVPNLPVTDDELVEQLARELQSSAYAEPDEYDGPMAGAFQVICVTKEYDPYGEPHCGRCGRVGHTSQDHLDLSMMETILKSQGGRNVELAEKIDQLRRDLGLEDR